MYSNFSYESPKESFDFSYELIRATLQTYVNAKSNNALTERMAREFIKLFSCNSKKKTLIENYSRREGKYCLHKVV